MKMPSSELKYCHLIPGLDFRLSARTKGWRGNMKNQIELQRDIKRGGVFIQALSLLCAWKRITRVPTGNTSSSI